MGKSLIDIFSKKIQNIELRRLNKHLDTYKTGVLFNNSTVLKPNTVFKEKVCGKDCYCILVKEFDNYIVIDKELFDKKYKESSNG